MSLTWQNHKDLAELMEKREWEKLEDEQFTSSKFFKGLLIGMGISLAIWFAFFRFVYWIVAVTR